MRYKSLITFAIKSTRRAHTSAKAHNNEQMGKSGLFLLYPNSDPDDSQHLMGSKLDQDPSSDNFFPVVFA